MATSESIQGQRFPLVEVDLCQMFFVDCVYASRFRAAFDSVAGAWPNYSYFDSLRNTVGIDFGYATVTSDGSYFLDLDRLEFLPHGPEPTGGFSPAKLDEYFDKVARRMNTFVCEVCFEEELMVANGQTAKRQGWQVIPPIEPRTTWFFEEFQVVGPKCAAAARAGSSSE